MKQFVQGIFKDKEGQYAIRELATVLFVLALLVSWVAEQFFGIPAPEYMFYAFASLVGTGCFGYSIERKSTVKNTNTSTDDQN